MTHWHQPTPGPIAVLTKPERMTELKRAIRNCAGLHDDTAWVHPSPPDGNTDIPKLSIDLLNAIGAVGIHKPPSKGENHLLRTLVHLIHGPVRNIVIHDAAHLAPETLTELHEMTLIGATQLWLLVDSSEHTISTNDYLAWVNDACSATTPELATTLWRKRPTSATCRLPPQPWWHQPLELNLPNPCALHAVGEGRTACLLSWARRAQTLGHVGPTGVRARLNEWLQHPDATIDDWWAATAARREFYTAGADVLAQLHPAATNATLADVPFDGSTVTLDDGTTLEVEPMKRHALARLRTSRRVVGCLEYEPVAGFFDQEYGIAPARQRKRTPGSALPRPAPRVDE